MVRVHGPEPTPRWRNRLAPLPSKQQVRVRLPSEAPQLRGPLAQWQSAGPLTPLSRFKAEGARHRVGRWCDGCTSASQAEGLGSNPNVSTMPLSSTGRTSGPHPRKPGFESPQGHHHIRGPAAHRRERLVVTQMASACGGSTPSRPTTTDRRGPTATMPPCQGGDAGSTPADGSNDMDL